MTNEADNNGKFIIEQYKKFSESCLWQMQRNYFDQEGINAWVNQVPFYITSNPFIAHCYAQVSLAYIRDILARNPKAKQHPFYILELGTGSGRFSYYVLKTIHELLDNFAMQDVQICYVMSDFTQNNIQYYETHPALQSYIEKGLVDFAIFDMEVEQPITLLKSKKTLDSANLFNPLLVYANYIFDTVSHDSFTVRDGNLFELLLSISTSVANIQHSKPIRMEELSIEYKMNEIKEKYYNDPALDDILENYKNSLTSSSFLFPIGSIRAIKLLKKLSNNKLFILSTDKGYNAIENLDRLNHPSLAFHGSFSMMVNFHALANYFKNTGGDYFLQTPRKGIKTSLFTTENSLRSCPQTFAATMQYVEGFSPTDYFTLHKLISEKIQECNLDTLTSHLNLSYWDPHIYLKMTNRIVSLVEEADGDTVNFLESNMKKLAKNYYYMPKSDCVLFEIAVFFHSIKRFHEALSYYKQALPFVGEQFGLAYNIALCEHNLGKNAEALKNFQAALQLDPESKEAKEWIVYLEKTST